MATEEDKVNNGAIATLIAVITLGVIAVALAVTALTRKEQSDEFTGKEGLARAEYQALAKAQREALDKNDSLENAMQTVVREIAKNPQSASPPAPPTTAKASAGAGGADAAAGAAGSAAHGGGAAPTSGGAPKTPALAGSGGAASPPRQPAPGGASAAGSPKAPAPATRNTPEHSHVP